MPDDKKSARAMRISEIPHGTMTGYQSWMCRCRKCFAAYKAWQAERLAALPPEKHGTRTAYTYGCRCDRCKTANALSGRRYAKKPTPAA